MQENKSRDELPTTDNVPAAEDNPQQPIPAKVAEPNPVPAKVAEPNPVAAKDAEPNPVPAKVAEPKPIPAKVAEPIPEPVIDREPKKKSLWRKMGSFWTTRQMAKNRATNNREGEVLIMLRELIIYLMFLILLLIISVGMQGTTMFTHRKALSNFFLDSKFQSGERKTTFQKVTHMSDFWAYTENVLIDGLLWDYWYERTPEKSIQRTSKDDKKIFYENKLLGLARIRQLRVRPQSCVVHDDFRRTFSKCWAFYSDHAEDKESFGNGTSGPAWTYASEEELGGSSHSGLLATYGGGGYYQDLVLDYKKAKDSIAYLKQNLWITPATRAIFIDFTVYNANINLFCICKLVMEFPPTGGVVPSWSIRTAKLLRYVQPFDYFVLGCEVLFLFFIIFYTFEEVNEIIYFKTHYFKYFWNLLDLTILCISYVCIGFSVLRIFSVQARLQKLLEDEEHYEDFSSIGFWNMQYLNAVAVAVFIAWIKIFKYISFNKTMSQLSNTLSRCAGDIGGFAVMFFIVFCAFAQLGYLIFGTQVSGFSSWTRSVITLLRTILGDFDYEAIENANRILGPIFFLLYIFFVFFVLLNMFLAIINDTYAEVKSEIASKPAEIAVLSRGWRNLMTSLGLRKRDGGKEAQVMSVEYLRIMLRKCNFAEYEIDEFFKKYGIDKPMIGEKETQLMLEDYNRANGRVGRAGDGVPGEDDEDIYSYDIATLEDRCRKMEFSVGKLNDRLEGLISTLEQRKRMSKKSSNDSVLEEKL